jgi:hypothetical protein
VTAGKLAAARVELANTSRTSKRSKFEVRFPEFTPNKRLGANFRLAVGLVKHWIQRRQVALNIGLPFVFGFRETPSTQGGDSDEWGDGVARRGSEHHYRGLAVVVNTATWEESVSAERMDFNRWLYFLFVRIFGKARRANR